jgi:ribosomal protein S18 acetylase RimI-like enzyme
MPGFALNSALYVMNTETAIQIASLLNNQNQLQTNYSSESILENSDAYIYQANANGAITGAVRVDKIQWYQAEIKHLSVLQSAQRTGIGTLLLAKAEEKARSFRCKVAQCTIRENNIASVNLFLRNGYIKTCSFINPITNHMLSIFQKQL